MTQSSPGSALGAGAPDPTPSFPHSACSPVRLPQASGAPSLTCSWQSSWGCWALLPQAGISLRRQSLPSFKLHRVFTSCYHCLSPILMGYFMVLVGWDGLKAEHFIPTVPHTSLPSRTGKEGAALPISQTRFPATEADGIRSPKALP